MKKKICKCCGRNRRIGRFGRLSAKSDGKNIYCRECMREFTKEWKHSLKGIVSNKNYNRKWRRENKNRIKEYNKEYYKLNKDRILYNNRAIRTLITENSKNNDELKINKSRSVYSIEIDPKRKQNG